MDSKELLKSDLTVNEIKNEQVESLQTDQKQNVQENDGENAVPQQASFSFDEKMHEVFKTPETSVRLQTDSAWLKESHKPEYERRLKKRHLLKKNEYEMVPVTTGKEEIVNRKKSLAAMVDKNVNERKSDLVRLQDGIDINVAKKTNFATVKNLSAFVENTKDQAGFTELVKSYTSGRFTVLSELTKKIMSMKPSDFDVSTMERIAETSGELERMASQLDAYQELLKANEDYKNKLEEQKDEKGISYLTRVEERLHELGRISRYYRIQKLIMEDSVYQNSRNNEIAMEIDKKDDFQTRRLKKLLRVSYYMGKNLSGADLPDLEAEGNLSQNADQYAKNLFGKKEDPVEGRQDRIKAEQDALWKKREKAAAMYGDKNRAEELLQKTRKEMEEISKVKRKQMLDDDEAMEMEVRKLEFERLFVPPDSLKLDLSKPVGRTDPLSVLAGGSAHPNSSTFLQKELLIRQGNMKIYQGIHEYKEKELKIGKQGLKLLGKSSFPEATGSVDKTVFFGDDYERMIFAYCTTFSYKQNADELLQVLKHLTLNATTKLEAAKNDPEAMKYYESCFADGAVKSQALLYAAIKRFATGVGDKPFLLHPKDMMLKMTPEMFATNLACDTITNHFSEGNEEKVIQFLEKHNTDGRYPIDVAEMKRLGVAYCQLSLKASSWLVDLSTDLKFGDESLFPKGTHEKIVAWWNEKHPNATIRNDSRLEHNILWEWLMEFHKDEVLSGELIHKRDQHGKEILEKKFINYEIAFMTFDGLGSVQEVLSGDSIEHTSEEEIAEYEDRLKKEQYSEIGPDSDPYLVQQFKDKYYQFNHDKEGNLVEGGMTYYIETYLPEKDQTKLEYTG